MTTTHGDAPLSKTTTPNGHGDPSPRSAAAPKAAPKTAAKTAPKAAPTAAAKAAAQGPAPKPLSALNIFGVREAVGALRYFGQVATRHPQAVLQTVPGLGQELVKIGLGRSETAPEKGDKRFADPAWQGNPLFKATMQSYLTWGAGLERYVDGLDLPGKATARLRFGAVLLLEAMAPSNFFAANPAAVKRAYDSGGGSVRRGLANWLGDLRHNHGMPTMVDPGPFTKGENLAATPGSVIYRNEVFELIQYTPQAETVYDRPLLVVPPQVNKYYALDLSPGRSMYEFLLQRGIQVYTISWRNPTKAHRDWDFDTYVEATIDATDVIRQVSGSPDVNIMGACLGGMTSTLAQAHLQAVGDDRIHSSTLTVTLLDTDSDGRMFLFATPQLLEVAKQVSKPTGIINGWQLGNTFAWLRPNDLVWNYWVNNYLMGQDPPAFDILAWNNDTTRLSTAFHQQMLEMVAENQMIHPGAMKIMGTPIDLSAITSDTFVAAGLTDHITPWKTCYQSTQVLPGHSEFVLCSSGHIQTVVADPKHRGIGYFVNPATPPKAEDWLAAAERREGSWWDHWAGWLTERSGEQSAAPKSLGSTRFPPLQAAPGSYISL